MKLSNQMAILLFCFSWRPIKLVMLHEDKCTCLPIHPQQAFCHSDFVIRAKIQEQLKNTSVEFHENETKNIQAKYRIQIQAVWKGDNLIHHHGNTKKDSNSKSHIETHIYTKLTKCALSLSVGKKYVLSGNMVGNKLYVSKCHWHTKWNIKSKKIRRNLRKGDFHCRCVVEPCFTAKSCKNNDPFVCYWPIRFKPRNCRFRSCKYIAGGCRWNKYVDMDLCKKL